MMNHVLVFGIYFYTLVNQTASGYPVAFRWQWLLPGFRRVDPSMPNSMAQQRCFSNWQVVCSIGVRVMGAPGYYTI